MALYDRIKNLCARDGITIAKLETELDFGASSIKKWEKSSSPSVNKLAKVADYFHVSLDYLMCRTDDASNAEAEEITTMRRGMMNMSETDRATSVNIVKAAFKYAFSDESNTTE